MARHGVTYTEVSEAASQLLGQGRHPTIEQVRLLLGTGSSTTIAAHLKIWREAQTSTSLMSTKENIPEELLAMVKGLWERMIVVADDKVKAITATYQASLNELQENLEKYRHNNQRWQHLYHQWNKEKDDLYDERRLRDQEYQRFKEEFADLKSRYDHSIQQLVDKQDHIHGLERLHEQFRLSSQEQRKSEHQQFVEQKNLLLTEMKKINADLVECKREEETLRKQCRTHEQNISTLTSEKTMLESSLQNKEKELQQCDREKHEHLQASRNWEVKYHQLQQDFHQQATSQQTEVRFLSQQLTSLQQAMQLLEDKNIRLQHENIDLIQAKSTLEGRIRQWELTENLVPA